MFLTLGGCDIVLGVQWLSTLGLILWDFVKLRMEFNLLDSRHVLQGITPTEVSLMNGEQFGKTMNQDKRGLVLRYFHLMHFAFLLLKLALSLLIYLTNSRKFLFLQHVLHFVFSSSSRSPSSEATAPETGPGSTQQNRT
jgi:membrane protein insertase Oxa1/YidC/SpoIIIJ